MNQNHFINGMKDGIPIGLGYFAVSFTFGIATVSAGIPAFGAALISYKCNLLGQFAGLTIIAANGTLLEMALTQFIINLRYCLMSFSLAQKLNQNTPFVHRFLMAFGVTD